jgi:integrase
MPVGNRAWDVDLWFEKMEQALEHPLGAYQLRHIRPVIIQAALDSSGVSADMRNRIRSVLVRAFDLAIFHEAINGNPATAVLSVPVPRQKKKPVPAQDLDRMRAAIHQWANAETRNGTKSADLPDIVQMLVATGMRIGELHAEPAGAQSLLPLDTHVMPTGRPRTSRTSRHSRPSRLQKLRSQY